MKANIEQVIVKGIQLINYIRKPFYKTSSTYNNHSLEESLNTSYNKQRPLGPLPKLCYAPWNNIFFNTHGKAIVCCKNTKIILGTYPENSIHDIWFGEKIQILRDSISRNDLSMGCYKCHEAIKQSNISSMTSIYYDKYGMMLKNKYPRVMEFELSNHCNLACIMCSERVSSSIAKQKNLSSPIKSPYDSQFVNQLDEFIPHLHEAKFFGGEPFVIDIYYDIWEKIRQKNHRIKILAQTNATILTDRVKNIINKGNFSVSVSLDSVDKNNYEFIRKNADFDKTMKNIKWFGDNTHNLGIVATPFRQNWKDIPNIVHFCNNNNYSLYFSPVFHPKELALWSWTNEALDEIISFYASIILLNKTNIQKHNFQTFSELVSAIKHWRFQKGQEKNFNNQYSNLIREQEKSFEATPKLFTSIDNINEAKIAFFEKLALFNKDYIKKMDDYLQKVNQNSLPLPPDSIFLLLVNSNMDSIAEALSHLTEYQAIEKLTLLYKKANEQYQFK